MKLIIFVLSFLTISLVRADDPVRILAKTKELKSIAWYEEQSQQWRALIAQKKHNAEAWLNYYAASRYAHHNFDLLSKLVDQMETAIPDSYEFYFVRGWHNGYSAQAYQDIVKAYKMKPDRADTYGLLTLHAEFLLDSETRKEFGKKMVESGQLSAQLLNYSYNVLMSVAPGSVLFTEGENTTLPLFLLQDVWKVRQDVVVLNLEMLNESHYRNAKLSKENLKASETIFSPDDGGKLLCADLPVHNADRKFYYALTLSKEKIESLKDQLYVVGLASQLSSTRIDNISLIQENLENRFLLDYLTVDFNGVNQFDTGRVLSSNYLFPFLLLYEHYGTIGDTKRQKEVGELVYKVAAMSDKKDVVDNFINRSKSATIPYFPSSVNVKYLEGRFRQISPKIWAEEAELTNERFNDFLSYLVKNNLTNLYEKYRYDLSGYTEPALSMMKGYTAARVGTKKEKFFTQHPAVSITYEAAVAYCEWLTEQYNRSTEKKYKRVLFRLPSVSEFQVAAAGIKNPISWNLDEIMIEVKEYPKGKEFTKEYEVKTVAVGNEEILYPWFRHYNFRNLAKNNKGCYLGNFKTPDSETPCVPSRMNSADGFVMMGPTGAYFPNDIGLYDAVGNVAEMTLEKGKACGGSWNHTPEESTIKSINVYSGPDSAIGFRVFMEIIEQ